MATAGLYFLPPETITNGEKYLNWLKSKLELHMAVHNCQIFMHNGAPCHQTKLVKIFLEQESIQMSEWPGNSPDLNPIENRMDIMKNKVLEKDPTSLSALQLAIESMPHRLQEVIKNKKGHTKC